MSELTEPISIRGRYFWQGDERFQLKGVVYQVGAKRTHGHNLVTDPLSDERLEELRRSLPLFLKLGLNAIFIYSIDNQKSHDKAMTLLAKAGIYVLLCLSTPTMCIDRNAPYDSYTSTLLRHYFRTIDCMAVYPNTLGFIAANGVINSVQSTNAASVIRAVVRDVKKYMGIAAAVSGQRVVPIGISSSRRLLVYRNEFQYLTGGRQEEAVDFFSFSNYSWSGEASMRISGYDKLVEHFGETHLPVFFSEYGSNGCKPRIFKETRAIYSPDMTGVFSGGFVYELLEGTNGFGMVKIDDDGNWEQLEDFANLKESLNACTTKPETLFDWSSELFTMTRRPVLPEPGTNWFAEPTIPDSPLDWDDVQLQIEDRQWVDLESEMRDLMAGELGTSVDEEWNILGLILGSNSWRGKS